MTELEDNKIVESRFLRGFFDFLNEERVEYAVIRNYDTLPETVPGTDIDLVIREKDFRRIRRSLKSVAEAAGYQVWKEFPKPWFLTHYKFSPVNPEESQDVVKVDFMRGGVRWLSWPVVPEEEIWRCRSQHNGIQVLDEPCSTLVTLLNKWLSDGVLKAKYRDEYIALDEEKRGYISKQLFEILGRDSSQIIQQLEEGVGVFNSFRIKLNFLRRKRFSPLRIAIGLWYLAFVSTLQRVLHPAGEFVVVIGPDGTGKSSLVDKVETDCVRMYKRLFRFHFFPRLKLFSRIDRKSFEKYESRLSAGSEWENRQKKSSVFSSLLRAGYHLFRFWVGYLFWIYPERVKGSLVIGERWCYDWLIDPQSKGVNLPLWSRRLLYGLCPKPDKVIVVKCAPETAEKRKGELPAEEIRRQMTLIDRYIVSGKRARVLQNDGSLEEGFKKLLNILCE